MSSNLVHGVVYSIQHYVIKYVSDLRQVGGFLHQLTDRHDLTEILLKVVLNTTALKYNLTYGDRLTAIFWVHTDSIFKDAYMTFMYRL